MIFPASEYQARLKKAQNLMAARDLDAMLLSAEVDFAYFAGFHTRFWQSPTRPWFLILPASGAPIAVIPSIGAALMQRSWVEDIRSWQAPDLLDDGVSLLAQTLSELKPARIGLPSGMETHLRMPLGDFERLKTLCDAQFVDDANIARDLRVVKSPAEIERIARAADIGGRAFARVGEIAHEGVSMRELFRNFQRLCLEEGADFVPYLAGGAGALGYLDVIAPAGDERLQKGDVFMLDTGLQRDGYFCDFNRNFTIGAGDARVIEAHQRLLEATGAAIEAARPGVLMSDLFHVMDKILSKGQTAASAGRMGHGLGLSLTEWPSIIPTEMMPIEDNMVLTIEPSIMVEGDFLLVHEENIVITPNGARVLSPLYSALEAL